jgi:hypothetical protein
VDGAGENRTPANPRGPSLLRRLLRRGARHAGPVRHEQRSPLAGTPALPPAGCGTAGGSTAFYACPPDHWRKLRSANPLGRFNREVGRRTDLVGIFPDDQSLIRPAECSASNRTTVMNDDRDRAGRPSSPRRKKLGAVQSNRFSVREEHVQYPGSVGAPPPRRVVLAHEKPAKLQEGRVLASNGHEHRGIPTDTGKLLVVDHKTRRSSPQRLTCSPAVLTVQGRWD